MFRQHYRLPEGTIHYGDKPDVILAGPKRVGIEIRRLFMEAGGQQTIQRKVVAEAQRIHQARSTERFRLLFDFDGTHPIRDPQKLSRQLADFAASIQSQTSGKVQNDLIKHMPEVSSAYKIAHQSANDPWSRQQSYHGRREMSLDGLQKVVREKEAKCRDYEKCDAYWLLVVVDYLDLAQDQETRIFGLDTIRSQVFERIILYKTVFHRIVEITPMCAAF